MKKSARKPANARTESKGGYRKKSVFSNTLITFQGSAADEKRFRAYMEELVSLASDITASSIRRLKIAREFDLSGLWRQGTMFSFSTILFDVSINAKEYEHYVHATEALGIKHDDLLEIGSRSMREICLRASDKSTATRLVAALFKTIREMRAANTVYENLSKPVKEDHILRQTVRLCDEMGLLRKAPGNPDIPLKEKFVVLRDAVTAVLLLLEDQQSEIYKILSRALARTRNGKKPADSTESQAA